MGLVNGSGNPAVAGPAGLAIEGKLGMGRFLVGAVGLTVGLTLFAGPAAGAAPAHRAPSAVSAAAQSTDVAGKAAAPGEKQAAPEQAQPKSKAQQPTVVEKKKKKKKKSKLGKVLGIVIGVVVGLIIIGVIIALVLKRRN